MAKLTTYSADEVQVLAGNERLTGLAEGSFVTATRDEDTFTKQVGADGEVTRSRTNNKAGSIEITVQQGSNANDILSALHNTDEDTGAGIFSVAVVDSFGRTAIAGAQAWVRKPADTEFARDAGERTWTIDCAELTMLIGGN